MAVQQIVEVGIGGRTGLAEIHPRLRKLVGLDEHIPTPPKKKLKIDSTTSKARPSNTDPVVYLESISDQEVHLRTGFRSLMLLLFMSRLFVTGMLKP